MHATSMENMRRCMEWYFPAETSLTVVDLGSTDVNGSYRTLLPDGVNYIGVDLEPGPGVDVVLSDPYVLPFDDGSVDHVVSGQMLEHCGQFWRVFSEIKRVLKPGGIAFMIAPSSGPVHRYPVDCYRFYPDSFAAIAEWAGLRLVHSWTDQRGPWRDIVGVFQNGGTLQALTAPPQIRTEFEPYEGPIVSEREVTRGAMSYLDVLDQMHRTRSPRRYLEIGIRNGNSLALSRCETVAVDPHPSPTLNIPDHVSCFRMSSDDLFFFHRDALKERPFDLAFIDGMHLCEFLLRDFMEVERLMATDGFVVIDDVLPNHPVQASRDRMSRVWTGDVWRFAELLPKFRKDLKLTFLDTSPTGLLVITNLDPTNTVLWDNYNYIARALQNEAGRQPDAALLARTGALDPRQFLADIAP